MMERTFVMIKPSAFQRGIVGEIISRFEKKGIKIVAMRMVKISEEKFEELYAEHKGKPWFEAYKKFITSGPCLAMVVEGMSIGNVVRKMLGKTNGREAEPGTMRGDYSVSICMNHVHATDSKEKAEREMKIFFDESDIIDWDWVILPFLYAEDELE